MKNLNLSLNPTYLCNFRCDFCYLTDQQLSDKNRLSLDVLALRLDEIKSNGFELDHVDLYGGEIALLGDQYLYELDSCLNENFAPTINVVTNLSRLVHYFNEDYIDLSVSFDFSAREQSDRVLNNIISLKRDVAILILASPKLLELDLDMMISTFNSIGNIRSVEIKPYSSNQANQLRVTDKEFESFIFKWLEKTKNSQFEFINRKQIENARNKLNNAFSDDHVYLTPKGRFAVLEFDDNEDEFFLELDNLESYLRWCDVEKKRVKDNLICAQCEYIGHCLTEHYRTVKSLEHSCNGYINLINSKSFEIS